MIHLGTHPPAAIAAVRRRLADQSGFGLIEVVVSAALLSVVVLALLAGIDGPAHTAAGNQQRAIAASLAQQDQDRMHGMRAVDLADYAPPARTQNVNGVNYTITSRGAWQSDASGVQNCLSNSAVVQYVDITSTVTWPAMRGTPVTQESLVAPENGAFNLIVQLQDEKGNAVTGLPVSISGPTGMTRLTNAFGCATFGHAPVGNYSIQYNRSGWVDPGGTTAVTQSATVASGTTSTVPGRYAQGAQLDVTFDTKINGVVSSTTGQAVTVANSGLPSGTRVFPPSGPYTPQTTMTTPLLFPFTDGYGVYAGNCASADPAQYNASYITKIVTPFGSHLGITVRKPAINIKVIKGGNPLQGATVKVTPQGSGCTLTFPTQTTNSSGALPSPAFPYGPYTVCAYDAASGKRVSKTVTNNNPDGTTLPVPTAQTFDISNNGVFGTCP